ncbi:enoyl-CoA hydratase/isomerase family protein [Rhizobium leguminosarum]|uniref:enoyl-CoA hydratase/isomerase family protein n=1 Tax=Rhizobium leguminosarum TaxID=384 RepID=UPI0024A98E0A|nr:enoyl-CoA hydratase/isomerase family protein [Rhizobium leguminosarum]MDI5929683.1 enoyl-CoA hydratase/isomerase family protein [Rhizobium leguminosarum]
MRMCFAWIEAKSAQRVTVQVTEPALIEWDTSRERHPMNYADYKHLKFEPRDNGVLLVTINRPEHNNAANARLHEELAEIWVTIKKDSATRVAVITGAGRAFSVGGDLSEGIDTLGDIEHTIESGEQALQIVYNMIHLDKPIVSAINGSAAGAGLAVALSADISIVSETAKLTDAHVNIGVASGDHAALLWPLYCGLPKAKLYLLTADILDGKEAERIGLVSMAKPAESVLSTALELADSLGKKPQRALRWTKRCLNHWVRQAAPIFDLSVAYEGLNLMEPDAREGLMAFLDKRKPKFPSNEDR